VSGDLDGQRVVVTGAATGVGRAFALEAARRGAHVVVTDVEDPDDTVALITQAGGSAEGMTFDVRDPDAATALADAVGAVDLVCANAGTGGAGTIDTLRLDDLRRIFDVNVFGVCTTVQSFLPGLRRMRAEGRRAHVLITGSEHSLGVPPYVAPMTGYTMSKHALLGFAACLRRDLADDGIGVTIACPSYVRTERLRSFAESSSAIAEILEGYGQDADETAERAFDGIRRGDFVVSTSPVMAEFVTETHREIIDAVRDVAALGAERLP
jgi:NAD(P)-dependent dehydrogenase (short-subunit alcohol dehydrogenase family)